MGKNNSKRKPQTDYAKTESFFAKIQHRMEQEEKERKSKKVNKDKEVNKS